MNIRQSNDLVQPQSGPKARVTTRKFGMKLGAFEFEFSSKRVRVDESLSPENVARRKTRQAFDAEYDIGKLRRDMVNRNSDRYRNNKAPDPNRAKTLAALKAYADTEAPEPQLKGQVLAGTV